jgi:hypothetical protein
MTFDWLVKAWESKWLQASVNIVAILTAIYTFYKSWIEKAKLSVYAGDAVRIVKSPDGSVSNLHLMCNLVNKTSKVGTVHRIEIQVSGPNNSRSSFVWNLIYKYLPGGQSVEKEIDPYPVAVPQRDSKLIFVGFQTEPNQNCKWSEGMYELKLVGWVNRKDRLQRSNLESVIHIQITADIIRQLSQPNPSNIPVFITVPVIEWERQHG